MKKLITIALVLISIGALAQEYEYDNLNRIKKVTYPNGTEVVYNYDALGNRHNVITAIELVDDMVTTNSDIKIYPNPTSTYLTVDLSNNVKVSKIQILDMQGRVVWHSTKAIESRTTIAVNLLSGTYLICIYQGNRIVKKDKIIVEN